MMLVMPISASPRPTIGTMTLSPAVGCTSTFMPPFSFSTLAMADGGGVVERARRQRGEAVGLRRLRLGARPSSRTATVVNMMAARMIADIAFLPLPDGDFYWAGLISILLSAKYLQRARMIRRAEFLVQPLRRELAQAPAARRRCSSLFFTIVSMQLVDHIILYLGVGEHADCPRCRRPSASRRRQRTAPARPAQDNLRRIILRAAGMPPSGTSSARIPPTVASTSRTFGAPNAKKNVSAAPDTKSSAPRTTLGTSTGLEVFFGQAAGRKHRARATMSMRALGGEARRSPACP